MPTPILQLPLVSPNQNQKETTINSALAILEAASNDARIINGTGNPAETVLGDVNFTRWLMQKVQSHTAAITVKVPALKRFFVVANEGTAPVTFFPAGGTALTNGAEVPAGKIVLMMSDGTNVRALSSGVSRLEDLTDVVTTAAANGQVLSYIAAESKWRPATIAEIVNVAFIDLTDAPTTYTGQGGKLVKVNAGATALEFVAPADFGFATQFTDLGDTPNAYTGTANYAVVVNGAGTGLSFVPFPSGSFTGLTQTPDTFVGAELLYVRVNAAGTALEFVAAPTTSFLALTDTPDTYTGQEGKMPRVNAAGTALEFINPSSAAGAVRVDDEAVQIQAAANKLNFAGAGVTVTDDTAGGALITIPGATAGGAVRVDDEGVQIQAAANKLNFAGVGVTVTNDTAGGALITIPGATGGPEAPHSYWRVRAMSTPNNAYFTVRELEFRATLGGADQTTGGTAIASSSDAGTTPAAAFDNTTAQWSSNFGDLPSGDGAWVGYQFATPVVVAQVALTAHSLIVETLRSGFIEYSDNGTLWKRAWRLAPQAAWTVGEVRLYDESGNADPSFLDLPDTPDSYTSQGGKRVTVKADTSGVEFIDDNFLNLADTPNAYSGQGRKKVRVNTGGTALEFVPDSPEILAVKIAAYTPVIGDANTTIPVNVAATVDVTIPANASVPYEIGTQIAVLQLGAAKVGMVAAAGVTLNKPAALTNLTREQYSVVMALKIGTDTWVLLGDLGAV